MKSLMKLVLSMITGSLLFSACSSDNKAGKLIPKDAALVIHVDGKSLSSKLTWEDIKQTSWFQKLGTDSSITGMQKELMQDPSLTGMDIKGDMVIFMQVNPSGPGQIVGEGTIADAKKFEDYYKKTFPAATVSKQDDISFMSIKDDAILAWKGDKFMFLSSMTLPTAANVYGTDSVPVVAAPAAGNGPRLIEAAKKNFALSADNSLGKNEKFSDLLKEEGDVHIYYNVEQMMKASMDASMMGMMKMDKFINGTISTYTVNFADGKIVIESKFYPSKELAAIFKKYDAGTIDENMIKNIPSQNIAGVMALNFKPEGLVELVKLTGMDGMLNMLLGQAGITVDDFVKANKGDLMVSISDLNLKKDASVGMTPGADTMPGYKKPSQMNYLFSVAIGDKPSFDKLISAGKKMEQGTTSDVFYNSNEKYFAAGNNTDAVKKYLAGGGTTPTFWDKLKGHGFGMFADIQVILKSIQGSSMDGDSSSQIIMAESLNMWHSFTSVGNGFEDGAMKSTTEIILVDKTINSLKALNKYFDKISGVLQAKSKKYDDFYLNPDSTRAVTDTIVTP